MFCDRVAQIAGQYPHQCLVLQARERSPNRGLDEAEALAIALLASSVDVGAAAAPWSTVPSRRCTACACVDAAKPAQPATARPTSRAPVAPSVVPTAPRSRAEPPLDLCCPITRCLFVDPVMAADGHTCAYALPLLPP